MPLLLLLFVIVPVVEVWLLTRIAAWLDWPTALLALLAMSVIGAVLVKREGVKAWGRFRSAVGSGRLPAVEVVDGALVLVGGAFMVTPGFLTDIVGLLIVVPPTRALVNRGIRSKVRMNFGLGPAGPSQPRPTPPGDADPPAAERTIDVEVTDVRRDEP